LTSPSARGGEAGYYLATFTAAADHIEELAAQQKGSGITSGGSTSGGGASGGGASGGGASGGGGTSRAQTSPPVFAASSGGGPREPTDLAI
jgi:hypothetical protein